MKNSAIEIAGKNVVQTFEKYYKNIKICVGATLRARVIFVGASPGREAPTK